MHFPESLAHRVCPKCDVTLDDEGTADVEQVNNWKEDKMTCQPKPANISGTSPGRMLIVIPACSEEIHVNPDVEDSESLCGWNY